MILTVLVVESSCRWSLDLGDLWVVLGVQGEGLGAEEGELEVYFLQQLEGAEGADNFCPSVQQKESPQTLWSLNEN